MTLQQTLELLESLFVMPAPRRAKCETLYRLAQEAPSHGCIVELGTFHGCGAIALAMGAKDRKDARRQTRSASEAAFTPSDYVPQTFTVDDYAARRGWANEPYGPEDEVTFWRNIEAANVKVELVKLPIQEAARDWVRSISLLFWDLGMPNRLPLDFWAWQKHVILGGKIALHDTSDGRLGAPGVVADATGSGRFRFIELMGGGVWVLERVK